MNPKWYEKIDWQPFLWFGCFLLLIIAAYLFRASTKTPEGKLLADLLLLGAGAVAPRIRSTVVK
jgi:hypothetical protein